MLSIHTLVCPPYMSIQPRIARIVAHAATLSHPHRAVGAGVQCASAGRPDRGWADAGVFFLREAVSLSLSGIR